MTTKSPSFWPSRGHLRDEKGRDIVNKMVRVADMTRSVLHQWRSFDGHEPAYRADLGRE